MRFLAKSLTMVALAASALCSAPAAPVKAPAVPQASAARIRLSSRVIVRRPSPALVEQTSLGAPPTSIGFLSAMQIPLGDRVPFGRPVLGTFYAGSGQDVALLLTSATGDEFWIATVQSNRDGTFGPPVYTGLGATVPYYEMAVADLDGDGLTEIVLFLSNTAVVFKPGAGGVLIQRSTNTLAGEVRGATLADTNGDGRLDMVVAVYDPGGIGLAVQTLAGNGNGSFQAPASTFPVSAAALDDAVFADLRGNGRLDLIGLTSAPAPEIAVYLAETMGYAAGAFYAAPDSRSRFAQLTVADVDADGHPDIVAADYALSQAVLYRNRGDGTLAPGTAYSTGAGGWPGGIEAADLNGDKVPELLAINSGAADLVVLAGNSDGSFTPSATGYAVGGSPWFRPMLADFDRDGKLDALLQDGTNNLVYLHGEGGGRFRAGLTQHAPPPGDISSPAFSTDIAAGDLNGDGIPDLVVGNCCNPGVGVTVFLGQGDGGLGPGVNYGTGGGLRYVRLADMSGTGKLDLVGSDAVGRGVVIFRGNGDGTFQTPAVLYDFAPLTPGALAVADLNGDGRPDIAVLLDAEAAILLNDGNGGARRVYSYPLSGYGTAVSLADMNGDGKLDLLVAQDDGTVAVLLGNGDGTFAEAPAGPVIFGNSLRGLATADFNGDGRLDLAVTISDCCDAVNHVEAIAVALGNGDGSFQAPVRFQPSVRHPFLYNDGAAQPYDPNPRGLRAIDLNQDGRSDLVWVNSGYGTVAVAYGKGDGAFFDPMEFAAGGGAIALTLADFNGDGAMDVATANANLAGATLLLNTAGSVTGLRSSAGAAMQFESLTFTATVAPFLSVLTAVPAGTVTFSDGSAALASAALVNGRASVDIASLSPGTHTITARYAGDGANFLPSANSVSIAISPLPPDFVLSSDKTSASVKGSAAAVFDLTVTPNPNFAGSVSLACGAPLPAGIACSFNPGQLNVKGAAASTVLTVTTSARAALAQPEAGVAAWAAVAWCPALFSLLAGGQRSRRRMKWWTVLLVICLCIGLASCGSQAASSTTNSLNPTPVSQSVVVTVVSGNLSHTLTLTIDIS